MTTAIEEVRRALIEDRKEVRRLFIELERLGYLEDRLGYDLGMFRDAYPSLTSKGVKDLYVLIYLWGDSGKSAKELLDTYFPDA